MSYEVSYECGRKPFVEHTTRGHWTKPTDFIYAGVALAFRLDNFFLSCFITLENGGLFSLMTYLLCLVIYVVPILVIQSFLGQFSSSGFISSFRMSPIFKGIGYMSVALNILLLLYCSSFATIPLLYLFHSFRPTLPWSCDGFFQWAHEYKSCKNSKYLIGCTDEVREIRQNCSLPYLKHIIEEIEAIDLWSFDIPSVIFFTSHFKRFETQANNSNLEFSMSWELIICNIFIWIVIAGVLCKYFTATQFGKVLRYCIWITLALLISCITRFLFLPGSMTAIKLFFQVDIQNIANLLLVPIYSLSALGAGWGSIVSLSSFNYFKTDIIRHSWIIAIGQLLISLMFGFTSLFIESYFSETSRNLYFDLRHQWKLLLASGSAIATMELPNLWSVLYYTMLILSALVVMLIQLYSILISVFDEFENLRERKLEVTLGLIGILALCSLYFCSNYGLSYLYVLSMDSLFNQTILNLLMLLAVMWIYGRERFQRDFEFMLGKPFRTWKVSMVRFVAPLGLLFTLFVSGYDVILQMKYSTISLVIVIMVIALIVLPWLLIPGYSIVVMLQTTGSFLTRLKRCSRPTDWYPVELEYRQQYEEAIGNENITHQLHEVNDN